DPEARRADRLTEAEGWEAEAGRLEADEAEERERVGTIALVDVSKDGQLRNRYLNEAQRSVRASLGSIDRAKHQREQARGRGGDPARLVTNLVEINRVVQGHIAAQGTHGTDGTDGTSHRSPQSHPSQAGAECRSRADLNPQVPVVQEVAPPPWIDQKPVIVAKRLPGGKDLNAWKKQERRKRREER